MQLLKFELYKIFKQKIIYITFLLLVLFSTGFTFDHVTSLEKKIYDKWEGPLTEEKVQKAEMGNAQLMKKSEQTEPGYVFPEETQIKWGIYETIGWASKVEKNAQIKIGKLKNEHHYNTQLEKEMLQDIEVSYFSYNKGPVESVNFINFFSYVITGTMLLIGLSPIFSNEYSTGVDQYTLSSKKGRTPLVLAKTFASLIYTSLVVFAWEIWNLAYSYLRFGSEGWGTSIHYLFHYYFSPYSFNMLEYHFIQIGFHLLGAFGFALMILLISSISKNPLITFFISGSVYTIPLLLDEINQINWVDDILDFSFISVVKVQGLFDDFNTVNLLGYPVLFPVAAVVVMVVMSIMFIFATVRIMKYKEVTS